MAALTTARNAATPATLPNWLSLAYARAEELGAITDQQKLDLLGFDRTMRWRYEGGMIPLPQTMRKIAKRLDMQTVELFAAELAA